MPASMTGRGLRRRPAGRRPIEPPRPGPDEKDRCQLIGLPIRTTTPHTIINWEKTMTITRLKSQNTKRLADIGLIALAALTMLSMLTGTALAHGNGRPAADRQSSDVYTFADPPDMPDMVGDARLTRTDSGVSYNLRTTGLEKGHATSIWWVIFNNPDECAADCALPDLFNPDVAASVQSGGGNMVGASGNSAYAGHLSVGETTNPHPVVHGDLGPPAIDNPGLINPRGAEIHLVVRTHGELTPGLNHEMFNTFMAGCTTDDGGDGLNENCEDLQFAIFLAPIEPS